MGFIVSGYVSSLTCSGLTLTDMCFLEKNTRWGRSESAEGRREGKRGEEKGKGGEEGRERQSRSEGRGAERFHPIPGPLKNHGAHLEYHSSEFQSGSLLSGQRRTASLQTVTPAVEGVETDGRKEPEVHRARLPRPSPPLASDHACLATSLRESCSRWAQRLDVWAPAGAGWRIPVSDEVCTELRMRSET